MGKGEMVAKWLEKPDHARLDNGIWSERLKNQAFLSKGGGDKGKMNSVYATERRRNKF